MKNILCLMIWYFIVITEAEYQDINLELSKQDLPNKDESKIDSILSSPSETNQILIERMGKVKITRAQYYVTSYASFKEHARNLNKVEATGKQLLGRIRRLILQQNERFAAIDQRQLFIKTILNETAQTTQEELINVKDLKTNFDTMLDHLNDLQHRFPNQSYENKPGKTNTRQKRSILGKIFNFLFGGSSMSEQTAQIIKNNLRILQENQKEIGDELDNQYNLINLTRVETSKNRQLLGTLDAKLNLLNDAVQTISSTSSSIMLQTNILASSVAILNHLQRYRILIARLTNEIHNIGLYLQTLSLNKLSVVVIKPNQLRKLLSEIQKALRSNPRLSLPADPITNIFEYYSLLKVTSTMQDDVLYVVLEIPLVDRHSEMELVRLHPFPAHSEENGIAAEFILERRFIALTSTGDHYTFPAPEDILACQVTRNHFCTIDYPFFPLKADGCETSLILNNQEGINNFCKVKLSRGKDWSVVHLTGSTWAITAVKTFPVILSCLTSTSRIIVQTPLHVIRLRSGCELHSEKFIIPSNQRITMDHRVELLKVETINERLINFSQFHLMAEMGDDFTHLSNTLNKMTKLTKTTEPIVQLTDFDLLTPLEFRRKIKDIQNQYPTETPFWVYLAAGAGVSVTLGIICILLFTRGGRECVLQMVRNCQKRKKNPTIRHIHRPDPLQPPSRQELEAIELRPLPRLPRNRAICPPISSDPLTAQIETINTVLEQEGLPTSRVNPEQLSPSKLREIKQTLKQKGYAVPRTAPKSKPRKSTTRFHPVPSDSN